MAHVSTPGRLPPKEPKKLNWLDQAPLNALERHALAELHYQAEAGSTNALALQELVGRLSRALAAYQSNYLPPIN